MTARRGQAHLWLACVVCGVAFAMWHRRRRQRALESAASPTRLAWPPPAPIDEVPGWTLSRPMPSFTPPDTPWLQRASVAIHLVQPRELAGIARELDAAGYPAAAGILDNYALLLERTNASRSRILVEVTRLLSTALADPPLTNPRTRARRGSVLTDQNPVEKAVAAEAPTHEPAIEARTNGLTPRPRSAGTAPTIPMPRPREAWGSNARRSPIALPERRRAAR